MATKKELYENAKAAGLKDLPAYDDITVAQLNELLGGGSDDEKEPKAKKSDTLTVKNLRKNPVHVAGVSIQPQGTCELTQDQLEDERLMAKLNHGVKTGVYAFV